MAIPKKKKKPKKSKKVIRPIIRPPEEPMAIIYVEYAGKRALVHSLDDANQAAVKLLSENGGLNILPKLAAAWFLEALKKPDYLGAVQIWTLNWKKLYEAARASGKPSPEELHIESAWTTRTQSPVAVFLAARKALLEQGALKDAPAFDLH